MDDEMKRELAKIAKGLADLSRLVEERLAETKEELKAELTTAFRSELKSEIRGLRTELKADIKHVDVGLQKLTRRFDDFLVQNDAARIEHRSTSARS